MLDKKTFVIGILSLSAVILVAANILMPHLADASYNTIKDNDYSMVTATAQQGGDVLYVTESRSGKMAALAYSPATHKLELLGMKPVQDAFAKALAASGPIKKPR